MNTSDLKNYSDTSVAYQGLVKNDEDLESFLNTPLLTELLADQVRDAIDERDLNQFQIVAEDILENEKGDAVAVPPAYPVFKYLFKIHNFGLDGPSKDHQRISRVDIDLTFEMLPSILGEIFSTKEESDCVQEFAMVQLTDENYYKLTELRLVFVREEAKTTFTQGLCSLCGSDSEKKCGACGL